MKERSFQRGNKCQHPAIHIRESFLFQFFSDVSGYPRNILLQLLHIPEDMMIDALQHIVTFTGNHLVGIIDMPFSQGGDLRLVFSPRNGVTISFSLFISFIVSVLVILIK